MLLEINFTLVVFALSFLVFIYLLNLTLYKPIGLIIEKRKTIVDSDLSAASASTHSANESIENYKSQLKQARIEAQSIIQEVINISEESKNKKISDLLNTLENEKQDALKKIKEEEKVTLKNLENEIKSLTDLITSKVLGEEKDLVRT